MSVDSKKDNTALLEDFIITYRDHPCLWRIGSKEYHDRAKKELAYSILLEKYKLVDPNADKDAVVKKINILRTNHRRQKKKVEEYANSGATYMPTLWYYHLFDFLDETYSLKNAAKDKNIYSYDLNEDESLQEETGGYSSESSMQDSKDFIQIYKSNFNEIENVNNSEHEMQHHNNENEENQNIHRKTSTVASQKSKIGNKRSSTLTESIPHECCNKRAKLIQEDRYELISKSFTLKLKDIKDDTQRLLAEKIMNDALFLAEMGLLTMSHLILKETNKS